MFFQTTNGIFSFKAVSCSKINVDLYLSFNLLSTYSSRCNLDSLKQAVGNASSILLLE